MTYYRDSLFSTSPYELARYPFLPSAELYIKEAGFTLEDASTPAVISRARERIELARRRKKVDLNLSDIDREIISFYLAMIIVKAVGSSWLNAAFARAEGERAKDAFKSESREAVCRIINQLFQMEVRVADKLQFGVNPVDQMRIEFVAPVTSYLRVNSELGQVENPKLSLVDNLVYRGMVYLTREKVTDMVKDQFSSIILKRLAKVQLPPKLPERVRDIVEEIRQSLPKPRFNKSAGRFDYIEKVLQATIQDGRHRILWLVLPPYLVNVKHMTEDEALQVIKAYMEKVGWREPRAERIIKYNIRRAKRIGLMPPTLERLKQTHPSLYRIIIDSIGKANS